MMEKNDKIYLAGHKGMVGSALFRLFSKNVYTNIIVATRSELDLRDYSAVYDFFKKNKPDYVILAAAKVGGINANTRYPVEFLSDNLMIQNNVIKSSFENKVKKFCFLGSSCIYPKDSPQPMKEEYLLTGPLEPTNEGYALAKIAGLRLAQYYNKEYDFSVINPMPCNLYGPEDSFDLEKSHVLSALVRRFVDAVDEGKNEVVLWGSGIARREFMHVDDLAEAIIFLMNNCNSPEIINIGCGIDLSIKELAKIISEATGYKGKIKWDLTKPDGMLRKCMDVSKMLNLGFKPRINLPDGIHQMIDIYRKIKKKDGTKCYP